MKIQETGDLFTEFPKHIGENGKVTCERKWNCSFWYMHFFSKLMRFESDQKWINAHVCISLSYKKVISIIIQGVPELPYLSMEYFRDLTVDTYQLKLASSYSLTH